MSMSSKVFGIFCSAIAITVLFILPAEYGYDPSGIGEKVGLLKLSESTVTINDEDSVNIIKGEYPGIPEDFDSWYPDVLGEPYSKTQNKIFSSDTIVVQLESGEQVEYKALMQGFFDADVIDIELLYDNAMLSVNYNQASKYGLKFILSGSNQTTEGMNMPANWNWLKHSRSPCSPAACLTMCAPRRSGDS